MCPATLAKPHSAMQTLGEEADRVHVQLVFVTVDLERDIQAVIRRYVNAFDPRCSALRPTCGALTSITDRYHAGFSYEEADASGNYAVHYSSGVYIFDGAGQLRHINSSGRDNE